MHEEGYLIIFELRGKTPLTPIEGHIHGEAVFFFFFFISEFYCVALKEQRGAYTVLSFIFENLKYSQILNTLATGLEQ